MTTRLVVALLCVTVPALAQLGVPLGTDSVLPTGGDAPSLAVDGQGLLVACYQQAGTMFAVSATSVDGGATWTVPVILDAAPSHDLVVATDRIGRWTALWSRRDVFELRAAVSVDGGATWSVPSVVHAGSDSDLSLVHDGAGSFVAAWTVRTLILDSDVRTARSRDGIIWSTPAPLDPTLATDTMFDGLPDLASDGAGRVMAAWNAQGTTYTVGSIDGGATWSAPLAAATPPAGGIGIATDGRRWLLVVGGTFFIPFFLATHSDDFGATWSSPAVVDPQVLAAASVFVSTDGAGNWLSTWSGIIPLSGNDGDAFASRSADGGLTWTPAEVINVDHATDQLLDVPSRPVATGAGRFLAPYASLDSVEARVRVVDLCPLLGPLAPGTGEDFTLSTSVGGLGCPHSGLAAAHPGDAVGLTWESPGATFVGVPSVLLAQLTPVEVLPPSPFPGIDVNPYVAPGIAAFLVGATVTSVGIHAAFAMPPGLVGVDLLFQAFATTQTAANGIFASSGLHGIRAR